MARVMLWFVRETEKARLYTKIPPSRNPAKEDEIWVPKSVCERTMKFADGMHDITMADWFAEKNDL